MISQDTAQLEPRPLEASSAPGGFPPLGAATQELLLASLAAGRGGGSLLGALDWATLSADDWREILAAATEQDVRGLLYGSLKAAGALAYAPQPLRDELLEVYRSNGVRAMRLLSELRRIALAFEQAGVPLIALKGAHLAAAVYGDLGLRGMHDLDILVRLDDLYPAADALIALGYAPEQPFSRDVEAAATRHHLPPFRKQGNAPVELHSNIAPPDQPGSVDAAFLWQNCAPLTVGGARLFGLGVEELLLHVCVHLSYHHQFAFGLRPLCDVAAIVDRFGDGRGLDWNALVERTRARGWPRGVYLALRLARDLVGAAVPDEVLAALRPGDVDAALLATAREQMFTGNRFAMTLPIRVARLSDETGPAARLRYLLERVFVPRRVVAERYALPARSWRVLPFYLTRVLDMARRHGPVLGRLLLGREEETVRLARRRNALRRWLS